MDEQQKHDLAKAGSGVAAALPKTLSRLLDEFMRQHAEEKLAPKTVERYREQLAGLDSELLKMPLADITPLHLSREWGRLLKSGGHTRRHKTPRPFSAKTVRNIAGALSSAFARAIKWGLLATNPVSSSEPPVPKNARDWHSFHWSKICSSSPRPVPGAFRCSWRCRRPRARAAARSWRSAGRTSTKTAS